MTFKNELTAAAAAQLACDYCCAAEDFLNEKGRVTLARISDNRRRFRAEPDFFKAATMGFGTVICAASEMLEYAGELLQKCGGAEIFEQKKIWAVNSRLARYNKAIAVNNVYFLPESPYRYIPRGGFNIRLFEEEEIPPALYPIKGFNNALLYNSDAPRRDKLAVCAFNGKNIMGIAGASSDSPTFWQIGIDVLPEYRGMGLGSELVSALTQEVFMHGAVPYYGTWSGNIASQNTARSAGYRPAWAEMFASDIEAG